MLLKALRILSRNTREFFLYLNGCWSVDEVPGYFSIFQFAPAAGRILNSNIPGTVYRISELQVCVISGCPRKRTFADTRVRGRRLPLAETVAMWDTVNHM